MLFPGLVRGVNSHIGGDRRLLFQLYPEAWMIISRMCGCLILLVAAACGGGDSPPITGGNGNGGGGGGGGGSCAANTFCMTASSFTPTSRTVAVNTVVNWTNNSGVVHNVTFTNPAAAGAVGSGASGNIPDHGDGTNSRVFATAGTHAFRCTIHAGMDGSVVVN